MLELVDRDRRRALMDRVARKMNGWQSIWMTSEHDVPSVAKGRYVAAKEFYEWLANGGPLEGAQAYLDERTKHWKAEQTRFEGFEFSLQLAQRIRDGLETPETLKRYAAHVFEGFDATKEEARNIEWLRVQYGASQVELWHLARLLSS